MSSEKPSGRGRGGYNGQNGGYYDNKDGGRRGGHAGGGGGGGGGQSSQQGTSSNTAGRGGGQAGGSNNNTALPPQQGHYSRRGADNKTPPPQHGGGGHDNYRDSNYNRRGGGVGGTNSHQNNANADDASMLPPPAHQLRNSAGGGYQGGYNNYNNRNGHNTPQAPNRGGRREEGYGSHHASPDEATRGGAAGDHSTSNTRHGYNQGGSHPNSTLTHTNTSNNAVGSNTSSAGVGGGGSANTDLFLSVMDMGLDFRSYQTFSDPQTGRPVVGNIVTFAAEKVPDVFQPTVGLLVTMLHMYYVSRGHENARTWIRSYETVQRLYLEAAQTAHTNNSLSASFSSQPNIQSPTKGGNYTDPASQQARDSSVRQAEEAIKLITQHDNAQSHHPDRDLCERLLVLLDHQSGTRGGGGGQAPSQRRVPPAPKATFCNLHLSDHKCHQDFSCNQVHLHQVGSIKHRIDYHSRLAQCLLANKLTPEQVDQRLRDSLFYAKYGNKVTIRCSDGSWVPFFKTLYTPARLDLALRKATSGSVKLQDPSARQQGSKPMDLASPDSEVKAYLDEGCREVYTLLDQKNQKKANTPLLGNKATETTAAEPNVLQILTTSMATKAVTSTPPKGAAPQTQNYLDTPGSTPAKPFQLQMTPPSMIPWASSLAADDRDETLVREYVRLTGISENEQRANDALLHALQVNGQSSSTPVTPESFTPLMHEVDRMKRFQSEVSLDGESFRM